MEEIRINGRKYDKLNNALLGPMAAMGYYLFRYFPKDGIIINEDRTVEAYQCNKYYTGMPFLFADEFVAEEDRSEYVSMYRRIDEGAAKASCVFRLLHKNEVLKVTLVPSAYGDDKRPTEVLGITENVTHVVHREIEDNKRLQRLNEELSDNLAKQQALSMELSALYESENEQTQIISGLASIFYAIYQIDFSKQIFRELFTKTSVRAQLGVEGELRTGLNEMVDKLVLPQTQASMRVFNEVGTMQERLKGKKLISAEYIGVTTGWSRASVIPNGWDENGVPVRALYCARSIGDEKEKLELQNNLIKALVANYQDVYIVNMDTGNFKAYRMNSEVAQTHIDKFAEGVYEESISIYIRDNIYEPDKKLFNRVRKIDKIKKLFEKRDKYIFTYREYQGGQCKYHQFQLIRPDKERNEFISALRDVDDEVRTEIKHARENQERLSVIKALSNRFTAVFFVNTSDGTVIPYHISHEMKNKYGNRLEKLRTWDALILEHVKTMIDSNDKGDFINNLTLANILHVVNERGSFIYEYKDHTRNEGSYYQVKAVPGNANGSESITIGIYNLDEERRKQYIVQKTLQDAYTAANLANSAKTDFLANMSHDIRTPMNAIIGMTTIAQSHIDEKERVLDCLNKIMSSGRLLLSLVNEVLDMSKIESGKLSLEQNDFNLIELVDNMVNILQPQIDAHQHELIVDMQNVKHNMVIGDSLRIQQIFMNLMTNAVKYTPNGGRIVFTLSEKNASQHNTGFYKATVEDNGIGMSEDFIEKLFEPFARADDERIRNIQGTGLGMVITRNIVNMMGGTIEVKSRINHGSMVTVTFFLKLREECTGETKGDFAKESMPHKELKEMDLSAYRALLVEDNELNAEIASEILGYTGMEVDVARDGIMAVDMMRDNNAQYDIIFMDVQMPRMNGYEAARSIRSIDREYCRQVPIIAMTANAFAEDVQAALSAGMNEHIAKPLDLIALADVLNKWVAKK